MITIDEHLTHILSSLSHVPAELIPLSKAHGRVLRETLTSNVDLPPWPNSAMDGYAVRHEDIQLATENNHITLPVMGDIPAGLTERIKLQPGTAWRIMTGAPTPEGCDVVIPLEKTVQWDQSQPTAHTDLPREVTFAQTLPVGSHIRLSGEDITHGGHVLSAGEVLTANRIGAIAATGHTEVSVAHKIRLAVISTGSELADLDAQLQFGQIYDSNSYLLASLGHEYGAEVVMHTHVADDANLLAQTILDAQQTSDAIIVTGGASVGAYDTTRFVLDRALGDGSDAPEPKLRQVSFTNVAMQPGKPQGFGVLSDGTALWALPGNPVSVWVSFYMFVEPAFHVLEARTASENRWQLARVSHGWKSPMGREQIMPIRVTSGYGEPLSIAPATQKGSGSHLAATLAQAQGIARVSAEMTEVRENELIPMRGIWS